MPLFLMKDNFQKPDFHTLTNQNTQPEAIHITPFNAERSFELQVSKDMLSHIEAQLSFEHLASKVRFLSLTTTNCRTLFINKDCIDKTLEENNNPKTNHSGCAPFTIDSCSQTLNLDEILYALVRASVPGTDEFNPAAQQDLVNIIRSELPIVDEIAPAIKRLKGKAPAAQAIKHFNENLWGIRITLKSGKTVFIPGITHDSAFFNSEQFPELPNLLFGEDIVLQIYNPYKNCTHFAHTTNIAYIDIPFTNLKMSGDKTLPHMYVVNAIHCDHKTISDDDKEHLKTINKLHSLTI